MLHFTNEFSILANPTIFIITIIVPTFEENGIFMLGVVFSFSQFSAIEIIVFNKFFYTLLKILTPLIQI